MELSIIIPVYNKAPFLKRCLDSVISQLDGVTEVVIIDDGSTDGSTEFCKRYATEHSISLFIQENRGVSEARNSGIDKANGEYVTFLDADDILIPDAVRTMREAAKLGYNIVQFRQYRCKTPDSLDHIPYGAVGGDYNLTQSPRYWVMAWNKIYKRSFLTSNGLRFKKGIQFGEDTIFNAKCIAENGGLYHSDQITVIHCLDDKNSLCRGNLTIDQLKLLDQELCDLAKTETDYYKKEWYKAAVKEHRNSGLFRRFGFNSIVRDKYDIVYFVKDSHDNEELRYSLRSVEENWPYNSVWFCGGCPDDLEPDNYLDLTQEGEDKWNKVRSMIRKVCENDNITEDFWLFNDDFFVLKHPGSEFVPQYNGELGAYIERTEEKSGGPDAFTERLREGKEKLEEMGCSTLNYEVHKPMLINRKKALEILNNFPDTPAFRSLYGNYNMIGGVSKHDMKIKTATYNNMWAVETKWDFVSTDDESFNHGEIGEFIRWRFNKPSRFEKGGRNENQ